MHVLVNDPTRGYGIFAENILDAAGSQDARGRSLLAFSMGYAIMSLPNQSFARRFYEETFIDYGRLSNR